MSDANAVYPLAEDFEYDKEALIRGMNSLNTTEKLVGLETVAHELLVVGRTVSGHFRCITVYLHKPSNQLGVIYHDIDLDFLRRLERLGQNNERHQKYRHQ